MNLSIAQTANSNPFKGYPELSNSVLNNAVSMWDAQTGQRIRVSLTDTADILTQMQTAADHHLLNAGRTDVVGPPIYRFGTLSPIKQISHEPATHQNTQPSLMTEIKDDLADVMLKETKAFVYSNVTVAGLALAISALAMTIPTWTLPLVGLIAEKKPLVEDAYHDGLNEDDSKFHLEKNPHIKFILEKLRTISPEMAADLQNKLEVFASTPEANKKIRGIDNILSILYVDSLHDFYYYFLNAGLLCLLPISTPADFFQAQSLAIAGLVLLINSVAQVSAVVPAVLSRHGINHYLGIKKSHPA